MVVMMQLSLFVCRNTGQPLTQVGESYEYKPTFVTMQYQDETVFP